jgi:hypothetical protein
MFSGSVLGLDSHLGAIIIPKSSGGVLQQNLNWDCGSFSTFSDFIKKGTSSAWDRAKK